MIFGEGPIIKNIAGDLNKLFLQGTRAGQPINNVEGSAAADQGTVALMADRDPVIRDISTGLGYAGREVTVSGTGALQLVNSLGRPLKAWEVDVLPYQEGTGDPSPSNVRPIHGTDKLTITTGVANLLPTYTQSVTQNGVTYTANPDGSVTVNGTATATNTYLAPVSTWKWDGVQDVWLSGCPTGGNYMNGYSLRVDPPYIGYSNPDIGNGVRLSSFNSQYNLANVPLKFCIVVRANTVCDNLVFRPMLNYGLSALPYQPYVAPSQTVLTLPQTVYAGTIGSEGGESRWGEVDLGDLAWEYIGSSNKYFQTTSIGNIVKPPVNGSTVADAMCEAYKMVSWNASTYATGLMAISGADNPDPGRLSCVNTNYTDVASFAAAMQGIKLVFELKTPTTFVVPSVTIPTPTGSATTWATAEDGTVESMEVTYVGKA